MPEKATEKVANMSASDPQKVSYRVGGVAKKLDFHCFEQVSKNDSKMEAKMEPKSVPDAFRRSSKRDVKNEYLTITKMMPK